MFRQHSSLARVSCTLLRSEVVHCNNRQTAEWRWVAFFEGERPHGGSELRRSCNPYKNKVVRDAQPNEKPANRLDFRKALCTVLVARRDEMVWEECAHEGLAGEKEE